MRITGLYAVPINFEETQNLALGGIGTQDLCPDNFGSDAIHSSIGAGGLKYQWSLCAKVVL